MNSIFISHNSFCPNDIKLAKSISSLGWVVFGQVLLLPINNYPKNATNFQDGPK
jgi:hypothetical protein